MPQPTKKYKTSISRYSFGQLTEIKPEDILRSIPLNQTTFEDTKSRHPVQGALLPITAARNRSNICPSWQKRPPRYNTVIADRREVKEDKLSRLAFDTLPFNEPGVAVAVLILLLDTVSMPLQEITYLSAVAFWA